MIASGTGHRAPSENAVGVAAATVNTMNRGKSVSFASRQRSLLLAVVVLGLALILLAACGDSDDTPDTTPDTISLDTPQGSLGVGAGPETTAGEGGAAIGQIAFSTDVAPILSDNCATCHTSGGPGSPHWELQTAKDAVTFAPFIQDNVSAGSMPPWLASDQSVPFHDDRGLTDDETATLLAWIDDGAQLDVAEDTAVESTAPVFRLKDADDTLLPTEPYQGSTDQLDDYRCLAYPTGLTDDSHLKGWEFLPDQTQVVHHAIGTIAGPDQAANIQALDDADPGAGWSCFNTSMVSSEGGIFLAWAPGQGPTEYPEGTGLAVEAGSTIIIQIHYHFDEEAPLDESTLEVDWADTSETDLDGLSINQLLAPAEIPCMLGETNPLCERDAALARNQELYGLGIGSSMPQLLNGRCGVPDSAYERTTDGISSSSCDMRAPRGELVSIMAHEHEIGTTWRLTLNPDTPDERILLDIPKWDFNWQYNYYPVESIILEAGDVLRMECAWDRSLIKPGLDLGYILWADGTNDEMCFGNMVTRPV
jgi:mono/diheme cytochrome c family protein